MKKFRLVFLTTVILAFTALSVSANIGIGESATGTLPVELVAFTANVDGDVVVLNWTTATEVNNLGFEVQKALNGVDEWETFGFVDGHGNSNSVNNYSFVDASTVSGNVQYRLKQLDVDGASKYSSVIKITSTLAKEFVLEQNYPNPFNPTTVISYSIPTASHVSVKVFDVLGNQIATLVNKNQVANSYKVNFNATELSNGVYFYKIKAGSFSSVKKMILLK